MAKIFVTCAHKDGDELAEQLHEHLGGIFAFSLGQASRNKKDVEREYQRRNARIKVIL